MQGVTDAYLAAIVANQRRIKSTAVINFVDNETVGSEITVVANELDPVPQDKDFVIDTIIEPTRKFAVSDTEEVAHQRVFAGPDLFPVDDSSIGWVGAKLSDSNGDLTGSEDLELQYVSPVTVQNVAWFADTHLGFPVDFEIFYDAGAGFISLVSIAGNAIPAFEFTPSSPILDVEKLKIEITKVSIPGGRARLIEFQGGYVLDVTDRIVSWEITRERETDDKSIPTGNASIAQIVLNLDNTDRFFYAGADNEVSGLLVANRKITVNAGIELPDGSREMLPAGTFYTITWNTQDSAIVSVTAWDRAKRMQEEESQGGEVEIDQTISELVTEKLTDFDTALVGPSLIDPTTDTIPFSFFEPKPFWTHMKDLAVGEGGQVYFNELGQFVFEARDHLSGTPTPVAELTDEETLILVSEDWDQARLYNRVIVVGTPLQEQIEQEVLNYSETVTVPAGGTVTITTFFSFSVVNDVQSPVITGHPDISVSAFTPYSWGMGITLSNINASDQDVTLITVDGKPLENFGGIREVAIDEVSKTRNGQKDFEIISDFIQSRDFASTLASDLVAALSDPGSLRTVSMRGRPELQLGDPIALIDDRYSLDSDFWIIRSVLKFDGSLTQDLTVLEIM